MASVDQKQLPFDSETWVAIDDYPNYQISNFARVRNTTTGRILKTTKDSGGYLMVILHKNGFQKQFNIHRLIALAFIPNPHNYTVIDHIDRCRTNNVVSNLRWCSISTNSINKKKQKNNTSEIVGVGFNKTNNCWRATWQDINRIQHNKTFSINKYSNNIRASLT